MELPINKPRLLHLNLLMFLLFQKMQLSSGSDRIFPGQTLSGNRTLSSKHGIFEMGLFSPGNSHNYYLGIWYKGLPLPHKTVVWVANREYPISDPHSSVLEFNEAGNLVLLSPSGFTVWSTNVTSGTSLPNSTVAVLGDDGNLIIRKISDSLNFNVSWQSFDHPTDTWLPGAQLGYDDHHGVNRVLTSWKDQSNPRPGPFSAEAERHSPYVLLKLKNETFTYGRLFSSLHIPGYGYSEWEHGDGNMTYFAGSSYDRYVLDVTGEFKKFSWYEDLKRWDLTWKHPAEECEIHCGNFTPCYDESLLACQCTAESEPAISYNPELGSYYGTKCDDDPPLYCIIDTKDMFLIISNIRYPVGAESYNLEDSVSCKLACLRDCSCSAYAYNTTCLIWRRPLQAVRERVSDEKTGGDIYVRVAASEIGRSGNKRELQIIVGAVVTALFSLSGICFVLKIMWLKVPVDSFESAGDSLTLFKYQDLWRATRKFTEKLGEGGFSTVYKGEFPSATFIAVKELRGVMQDEKQLRAELSTIGVIQHKNIVRLLGFGLKGSKRFLVYDYMPNGSLESHLFQKVSSILDWGTRYSIAIGTAKGLAYLHEECRDCIMHFDIKPENILLDADYTPKVADFGLAKLLCQNSSRVLTTMRGTRG